jgi:hypothetical protein
MSRMYVVDRDALRGAPAMLGIVLPVRVFVLRYTWVGGRYIDLRNGEHRIGVASDLSAALASRTIWHELTHALQVERYGDVAVFWESWWAEMREAGLTRRQAQRAEGRRYRRTRLEAEATANERLHRELALTIPARPRPRLTSGPHALRFAWL